MKEKGKRKGIGKERKRDSDTCEKSIMKQKVKERRYL